MIIFPVNMEWVKISFYWKAIFVSHGSNLLFSSEEKIHSKSFPWHYCDGIKFVLFIQ